MNSSEFVSEPTCTFPHCSILPVVANLFLALPEEDTPLTPSLCHKEAASEIKGLGFFGGHSPSVSELINFFLSAKTLSSNQLVTPWVCTLLERRGAHLSFFKTSQFVLGSHISAGGGGSGCRGQDEGQSWHRSPSQALVHPLRKEASGCTDCSIALVGK